MLRMASIMARLHDSAQELGKVLLMWLNKQKGQKGQTSSAVIMIEPPTTTASEEGMILPFFSRVVLLTVLYCFSEVLRQRVPRA